MSDASACMHAGEQTLVLGPVTDGAARAVFKKEGRAMITQNNTRSKDLREFWMIYAVTWPVFFVAAIALRLIRLVSPAAAKTGSSNLFHETHELASSSIPYAFMG